MPKAYLVAGLAFGDEGKGSIVDYLCRARDARLVVRYNGGPQATHNVHLPDGRHHVFSQLGSGMFVDGVDTYLSSYMLVEPYCLASEIDALEKAGVPDVIDRLYVSHSCPIITPWHWLANRLREKARGEGRHGSCGMGIGEVQADRAARRRPLTVGDVATFSRACVVSLLEIIRDSKLREMQPYFKFDSVLADMMLRESAVGVAEFYRYSLGFLYRQGGGSLWLGLCSKNVDSNIVLEGAQGVLLDEKHGFAPYNTWSCTTFSNAYDLLRDLRHERVKIGVVRTYLTRHGAGPFPTETPFIAFPDDNKEGPWQGPFRQGYFDAVMARYAIRVLGGLDFLALTHLDRVQDLFSYANIFRSDGFAYENLPDGLSSVDIARAKPGYKTVQMHETITSIELELCASVGICSYGNTHEAKACLGRL